MDTNIEVVIRVRPLIKREVDSNLESIWSTDNNRIFHKEKDKDYSFDQVFGIERSNADIYNEIGKPLVQKLMQGINGTLFAYGQTASGKTHTIMGEEGSSGELGIVPLAMKDIFASINESQSREFLLRASYLEIYNEEIKDLLPTERGKAVKILNTVDGDVVLDNLGEHTITSYEQVMKLIQQGIGHRKVGTTNMNERSSRSHCICRLVIESRAMDPDISGSEDDAVIVSQLNLVDLAGSERASQTGAQGLRLKESTHINTSLLTLGVVIRKLTSNESNVHIPYRDSKLTRILQHSLGGNAKTTIIATVSPVVLEETMQTLQFAARAKNVKNKPVVNEIVDGDTQLRRQKNEITDLKRKIAQLEGSVASPTLHVAEQEEVRKQKRRVNDLLKEFIYSGPNSLMEQCYPEKKIRRQTCCPGQFRMAAAASSTKEDYSEVFDDTTLCFEKFEHQFQQEEQLESKGRKSCDTRDEVEQLKKKDDEIENLLKLIKSLQGKVSDIATFKDIIETLTEEGQFQQSTIDNQFDDITKLKDAEEEWKGKNEYLVSENERLTAESELLKENHMLKDQEMRKTGERLLEFETLISQLNEQLQSNTLSKKKK